MRYLSRAASLLVVGLLLVVPVPGAEEAAKKNKDKDKETPAGEQLTKVGEVTAKIMAVVEDKKSVRIQVEQLVPVPNPGGQQQLLQAQFAMARARSPQAMMQAQMQMVRAQQNLVQIQRVTKDYELQATDDVKVRMMSPPPQFDDKGRVKKYTGKELKELKGNDKLPGYPGEFSDLKQDQIVQVTLVSKKAPPRPPAGAVKKGKDSDPSLLLDNLPQISMVMILVEPKN
jgi:hypothetical protein